MNYDSTFVTQCGECARKFKPLHKPSCHAQREEHKPWRERLVASRAKVIACAFESNFSCVLATNYRQIVGLNIRDMFREFSWLRCGKASCKCGGPSRENLTVVPFHWSVPDFQCISLFRLALQFQAVVAFEVSLGPSSFLLRS